MAICRSYIKNPEALRFQKELFARTFGKHYSILTRIAHCVCQVAETAPAWVKEAKARAARLVKHWKTLQVSILNFLGNASMKEEPTDAKKMASYTRSSRWEPNLQIDLDASAVYRHPSLGRYQSFCRAHQGGFQGWAKSLKGRYDCNTRTNKPAL